jgi:hypothetical protein
MVSDFQMVSTLLPYCDAMLVDRECHGLLKNTRDDLLQYLREIEPRGAHGQGARSLW